jgi:hypothetical protein
MTASEANRFSMAFRFQSPVVLTSISARDAMPVAHQRWTITISKFKIIDESYWRSVASYARRVLKSCDDDARWRIMKSGRIGPKRGCSFTAHEEVLIDMSQSHAVAVSDSKTQSCVSVTASKIAHDMVSGSTAQASTDSNTCN